MLQAIKCEGLTFSESCLIEEYYFLYGIAALLRPKRILEIGANMGLGTLSLWKGASATNTTKNVHIVTIEKNPACIPYIKKNWEVQHAPEKFLHIMNDYSQNALQELTEDGHRFGLCFIDGDHSYEGSKADWLGAQKLTDFWIMHDSTQMAGVRKLVEEIRSTDQFDVMGFDRYPFGTQWNQPKMKYVPKRSIPGITLVKRRGTQMPLPEAEMEWLELVLNKDA